MWCATAAIVYSVLCYYCCHLHPVVVEFHSDRQVPSDVDHDDNGGRCRLCLKENNNKKDENNWDYLVGRLPLVPAPFVLSSSTTTIPSILLEPSSAHTIHKCPIPSPLLLLPPPPQSPNTVMPHPRPNLHRVKCASTSVSKLHS
jgi:hypothetical protein